jgi:hypothetical protein
MDLDSSGFRNNEIEFLRTCEVPDARVSDTGRFLSRNGVVPYAHLLLRPEKN